MTLSRYFAELNENYHAEIEDLRHDSEGRDVLQARLKDKRRAFRDLLPMIAFSPEMVAPAFHGAFGFEAGSKAAMNELLSREPGEFQSWAELASAISLSDWALPLVDMALQDEQGEDYLSTVVGLEYLRSVRSLSGAAAPVEHEFSDETDADEDDEAMGEDFLEQQGFDRRSSE
jgi:hypothetical protein